MKVLRGKLKGQEVRLRQWANDWISADDENGHPLILSPTHVQLTGVNEFLSMDASRDNPNIGSFWREFELLDDGTFRKVKHA